MCKFRNTKLRSINFLTLYIIFVKVLQIPSTKRGLKRDMLLLHTRSYMNSCRWVPCLDELQDVLYTQKRPISLQPRLNSKESQHRIAEWVLNARSCPIIWDPMTAVRRAPLSMDFRQNIEGCHFLQGSFLSRISTHVSCALQGDSFATGHQKTTKRLQKFILPKIGFFWNSVTARERMLKPLFIYQFFYTVI